MEDFVRFFKSCGQLAGNRALTLPRPVAQPKSMRPVSVITTYFKGAVLAREISDIEELALRIKQTGGMDGKLMLEGAYFWLGMQDLQNGGEMNKVLPLLAQFPDMPYTLYQGLGAALAELRIPACRYPEITTSFWGWMTLDVYGFCEGYFRWPTTLLKQQLPEGMTPHGLHAFDQGVGRGIFSMTGAVPKTIESIINNFPHYRRDDLWTGVGMMTSTFGLTTERELKQLRRAASKHDLSLQKGVALGMLSHLGFTSYSDYAQEACFRLCQATATEVITLANENLQVILAQPLNFVSFMDFKDRLEVALNN